MDIFLQILLLVVGFGLLIKGADWFVDGASGTAEHFKVPKTIIGLTIVAFGTSAPEFAISVQSLISGNTDMMLGNVIGSNILNITLILGMTALIRPIRVKNATVKKELPITLLITVLFATLISDKVFNAALGSNDFTQQDGVVTVIAFSIFMYYLVRTIKRSKRKAEEGDNAAGEGVTAGSAKATSDAKVAGVKTVGVKVAEAKATGVKAAGVKALLKSLAFAAVGLAGIVLGSDLVVENASGLAGAMGIPERIVALTVVAIGTSLPELVTSLVAAKKGETDLAVGNIVGSNIFNIGIVTGLPVAILGGIPNVAFSMIDVVMVVLAIFLLYVFAKSENKISRWEGAVFLAIFVAYYGYIIATAVQG